VTLKGREPIRLWKWLLQLYGPVCHFERKGATVSLFHELMARYAMKEGLSPYENSQLAYRFCMTLISELQCDSEDEVGVARAMRQVETYCLQHLGERLDIVRLSKIAGYSRFHFSRLFKQHFGVSPSVYVKKMKLDRAKYLLNHRGLGVSEVSTQMGFEDSSYFCRIYRAEYGTSPKGKP
jgi:AraC-like DNA-binding protein